MASDGSRRLAHSRGKFFNLAELGRAPLAIDAVRRIDAIFDIERSINGMPRSQRLAIRQQHVVPLISSLQSWMRAARNKISRHADVAKAIDYMFKRWEPSHSLNDGRICLSNNAPNVACAASHSGAGRGSLLAQIDVADVLARIGDHPASRLDQLLPWNGRTITAAGA